MLTASASTHFVRILNGTGLAGEHPAFLPWNVPRLRCLNLWEERTEKNSPAALPGNPAIRLWGPVAFRHHLSMALALFLKVMKNINKSKVM
jgi:hypothetical protein